MIPIGDSPRSWRTPWVNLSLIAANVLVFLYELSLGPRVDPFLLEWGVVPARISGVFAGPPAVSATVFLTLVTAAFLHGGWLHLGGNMLFLWIFGDNVEDRLGHGAYLLFYLICGVVANLGQIFVDPGSTIPAIGASGAIAGVLGAYAITFPGARVSVLFPILFLFWPIEIPALIMIGIWFVGQFFSGVVALSTVGAGAGGVAWWAHVAGFSAGIGLMLVLPKTVAFGPSTSIRGGPGREDTGLAGLLIGTVSMVSQLVQLAIAARILVEFLGPRQLGAAASAIAVLIRLTTPLVEPFATFFRPIFFAGRPVEVAAIVAILVYAVLGVAVVRAIASLVDHPRRGRRRVELEERS